LGLRSLVSLRGVPEFRLVAVTAGGRAARARRTSMKKLSEEFKDFLNKGDFVTIAVGLVMALYFKAIVDGLLNGILYPLIAAIFKKPDLKSIGFNIGEARFGVGLVIDAVFSFIVVGFMLFLLIKAYNVMIESAKQRLVASKAAGEVDAEPEDLPETELSVLREIRDSLHEERPVAS
jgi:large conductance mechanosensitive channel